MYVYSNNFVAQQYYQYNDNYVKNNFFPFSIFEGRLIYIIKKLPFYLPGFYKFVSVQQQGMAIMLTVKNAN